MGAPRCMRNRRRVKIVTQKYVAKLQNHPKPRLSPWPAQQVKCVGKKILTMLARIGLKI